MMGEDGNALFFEGWDQAVIVGTVLIPHKFMGNLADLL